MPLKVIGAGFGRTGTLSLKFALEQLGFGPCHHMIEVIDKPNQIALWQDAAEGKEVNWEAVFDGYDAAVDWPVCHFWQELSVLYPEAKIILTKREAEKWYDSANATIFKSLSIVAEDNPHRTMVRKIIVENTFGGDLGDRRNAVEVFEKHNQKVIDTIDSQRLLIFEASDGWPPLCEFLDVKMPDTDYPRVNSTADFKKRFPSRE